MPNLNDTYANVLAAYSGSVNDKRSARLTEYLGYAKPLSLNDMEKATLLALGHSGSLNDAWDAYLKSLGGSGFTAKADLLSSTFYGNPVPGLFAASEPGAWYDPSDLTTLFQDSAGTTPVTGPNQTIGLMLDKSQGLVLGPELVVNGTFDTDTVWVKEAGWSISGGAANKTSGVAGSIYQVAATLVQGSTYLVTFTVSNVTSGAVYPQSKGTLGNPITANGTYTQRLIAGSGSTARAIEFYANGTFAGSIDNISFKLLAGNHATQATSTQRPIYGINPITGTRNLLTYTEQFDNAAWAKFNATVTANALVAPDGMTTADTFTISSTFGGAYQVTTLPIGTVTASAYFKASTANANVALGITDNSVDYVLRFNVTTGAFISASAGLSTYSITSIGDGWYRAAATRTLAAANPNAFVSIPAGTSGNAFSVWGAQLELGSTATAYQKVVSQYEVTQAGVASAAYVAFDGVDDGMVTGTITPNTDKVQVFAGVRKLSDAATAVLVESSTSSTTNDGTFAVFVPLGAAPTFNFRSKGTLISGQDVIQAAPTTQVLSGIGDIASDTAVLRLNGIQVASPTTDQGTGNYLAYPLYLGRRGGTTLPYNGRLYSMIVRFGANLTNAQITSTESWVNSKVGAY